MERGGEKFVGAVVVVVVVVVRLRLEEGEEVARVTSDSLHVDVRAVAQHHSLNKND